MASSDLPTVLMLRPLPLYYHFESEFTSNFHFIKAHESPLPLADFLASSPAATASTAMYVSAIGPPITRQILRLLPSLRCIVTSSVGVDHIDLIESRRRGISIASAGDLFSDDTADTAVGLLVDAMRRISSGDRCVRTGSWKKDHGGLQELGSSVRGKRVGIVGLGRIGSKIARRLSSMGCSIQYTSRSQNDRTPYKFFHNTEQLAAESDVLMISCALTEETRHMVNATVLRALGSKGVLVNVARGAVVHQDDLVDSLVKGWIAAAGLDVFENEPFVPDRLKGMDNVVLTPHMAVYTIESYRGIYECVTDNLKAFFSGRPLITPVL